MQRWSVLGVGCGLISVGCSDRILHWDGDTGVPDTGVSTEDVDEFVDDPGFVEDTGFVGDGYADTGSWSEGEPDCDPVGDLSERLVVTTLVTDVKNAWDTYVRPIVMDVGSTGTGWIGWPATGGAVHLTPVDGDLTPIGEDLVLPYQSVYSLVAHDDGTVAALVAKKEGPGPVGSEFHPAWPPSLYLVRYDASGQELLRVHLRGGEGFVPDPDDPAHASAGGVTWFLPTDKASLVFDGARYGAYYLIGRRFFGGGVHQADEYVEVDPEEGVTGRHTWIGSHAFFVHQAVTSTGDKVGIAYVHPKQPHMGVVFHDWDHAAIKQFAWPEASRRDAVDAMGNPVTIGNLFRVDHDLYASISTYVTDDEQDWDKTRWFPRLIRMDEHGQLLDSFPMSTEPIAGNAQVFTYAAPFGPNRVFAVWSDFNGTVYNVPRATVGVYSLDGRVLAEPRQFQLPLMFNMNLASLPSGDVAWIHGNPPSRDRLTIVRWKAPECRGE